MGAARRGSEAGEEARADLLFTVRELVPVHGPPVLVHVFEPPAYRLRAMGKPSPAEARRYAKDGVLSAAFKPFAAPRARRHRGPEDDGGVDS